MVKRSPSRITETSKYLVGPHGPNRAARRKMGLTAGRVWRQSAIAAQQEMEAKSRKEDHATEHETVTT